METYGLNINQHIRTIYNDNELTENSTIKKFLIVQNEGNRKVSREVVHYNLQMIIAVGFKVNNERAIQFGMVLLVVKFINMMLLLLKII